MDTPRSFRAEAVVLNHQDWGEADRLVTLYTRQHGKLRAVVKGARKTRSRKGGHLQPFTHVVLQLARARGPFIITQAETISAFPSIGEDLTLTGQAAYLVELLQRFSYDEEESNPAIFRLLVESLTLLAGGDDPWLVARYYEMRLLDYLGFRPQLQTCIQCGEPIQPQDQFFSGNEGGVICPDCVTEHAAIRPVKMETLKYLRHFQRSSYNEARRADPEPAIRAQIENLMQFYLTYLLERGLNSPRFIREMERGKPDESKSQS